MVAAKYTFTNIPSVSGETNRPPNRLMKYTKSNEPNNDIVQAEYCRRVKYWQAAARRRPSEYAKRLVSYDTAIAKQCLAELDKLDHLKDQTLLKNFVLFAAEVDHMVQTLSGLKDPFYLKDPRLAYRIVKRLNEHHRNDWNVYSNFSPEVPILIKLAIFLKGLALKAHRFTRSVTRSPTRPPKPSEGVYSYRANFEMNELLRQSMKQLETLPRLESPAPAHQLVLFTVVLRGVISMLLVKKPALLSNQRLFDKVRDRLNPFYTWRWDVYAANQRCALPDLVALDRFITNEAARVSPPRPPASMFKPACPPAEAARARPACLCCEGQHEAARCGVLRGMGVVERLRWAHRATVCQQCLARHPGRCRAPRCSVPHCHRPHHVMLHTKGSIFN